MGAGAPLPPATSGPGWSGSADHHDQRLLPAAAPPATTDAHSDMLKEGSHAGGGGGGGGGDARSSACVRTGMLPAAAAPASAAPSRRGGGGWSLGIAMGAGAPLPPATSGPGWSGSARHHDQRPHAAQRAAAQIQKIKNTTKSASLQSPPESQDVQPAVDALAQLQHREPLQLPLEHEAPDEQVAPSVCLHPVVVAGQLLGYPTDWGERPASLSPLSPASPVSPVGVWPALQLPTAQSKHL